MHILLNLLLSSIAVFVAAKILPGIKVENWITIVIIAIVLGAINTFIKPILIILTLPINILTLGFFIFVINALLVMLTSIIVPGFFVENFWWAFLFSLVVSLVGSFLHGLSRG